MCLESSYTPSKSPTGRIDAFVSVPFHKLLVHDSIKKYKPYYVDFSASSRKPFGSKFSWQWAMFVYRAYQKIDDTNRYVSFKPLRIKKNGDRF
jgi:hypothetical protein